MERTIREYHIVMSEQRRLKENGYAEITYTDHYPDGIKVDGTEDFSIERWKSQVTARRIYIPTGKVNEGGHRTWEYYGSVYARTAKDCGEIARLVMAGKEISVRKY